MARRTIRRAADLSGTGLHTGASVTLRVLPGATGEGICFRRIDQAQGSPVHASLDGAVAPGRRTALGGEGHGGIETVEHLLAAVAARRIDDLLVEVNGPELPIADGSFAPFCALLDEAGIRETDGRHTVLRVETPFSVVEGDSRYEVRPADATRLEVTLEYDAPVIGTQSAAYDGGAGEFEREISAARTYGFASELDALRARGLIQGAHAGAGIVVSPHAPVNTRLRWPNEFARHKLGDLLGDLALLGGRLAGAVSARRPGHRGNLACARAIATRARIVEED